MTIGSFFSGIGKAIAAGAKSIINMIFEAKAENILKAGLFLGTTAVSAVLLLKSMRNKHQISKNDNNMSTVDRALALNYTDKRNRDKLSPILSEVKKTLGSGKKSNKKLHQNGKRLKSALAGLDQFCRRNREVYDPRVLSELEKFERDMKEIEMDETDNTELFDNNFALRRAWDRA